MNRTILIATEKPFAGKAIKRVQKIVRNANGFDLKLLERYNGNELKDSIKEVEALVVRSDKVPGEVIKSAKKLRIVVRAGAGYDNIDIESASRNKVVVMNTPGQNSNGVAELAFGLMLGLIRRKYLGGPGSELKGKSIGLHGFGHIGKCMAQIAKGFNMKVYAYDPYVSGNVMKGFEVKECKSAEELYKKVNFVSLNIPVNEETERSINYKLLSKMKKRAVLVNTARKDLIDEKGLMRVMKEREEFMYASDIAPKWKVELEEKFPMRTLFTSKKMGAQTVEANMNSVVAAVNQIINFFEKGDTTFQVNN